MLYYLNDDAKENLQTLKRTNLAEIGWKEEDLEKLVTKNLVRILDEESLMPIFSNRNFQEEPDIMALDKKGKLYIIELKRWQAEDENLLQVLRYGHIFGQKSYVELQNLFFLFNKSGKSLIEEHQEYFNLVDDQRLEQEQFNKEQHFLIVTDSTDRKTRSSINYWKKTGLHIDSITYRVYTTARDQALIEFNPYVTGPDAAELDEPYYIVDTNFANDPVAHDDMIKHGKAAAYYHPWKNKINKIEKGDTVFLYKSGVGIMAVGKGTGVIDKETYKGMPEAEYNTKLEDFIILPTPLPPAKIIEITNSNIVFNQTMFSVAKEKGYLIWKYILENIIKS